MAYSPHGVLQPYDCLTGSGCPADATTVAAEQVDSPVLSPYRIAG